MKNYKLSVSKNGKKYSMIFKAESEKIARERIHKEGYSILSIEETKENINIGNVFVFTALTSNGELKKGKIVGNDIFKVYVKLRKNLEYDVKELFFEKDKNIDKNEKARIIQDLNDEYLIFEKNYVKNNKIIEKSTTTTTTTTTNDNFYLKKELDETYKLINYILKKIENLLSGNSGIDLDLDDKEKIKVIYNGIIKLKKSTNLSKLKEIGELALLKVGEIELDELENKNNLETKGLLEETNLLLKKIGSKKSFIEKSKSITYFFKSKFEIIKKYLKGTKKEKKEEIDKHSHSYIKNILFLNRYNEKLKENTKYILNNIFSLIFNKEKRLDAFIRRKVIKQNITLFIAKEKGIGFSYTSVVKGFNKITEIILKFISHINGYLYIIIFLYTFIFILILNINFSFNVIEKNNIEGIFYFLLLLFIYLLFSVTKNIFHIILNFVILFFIIIFGVVNF